MAIKAGALRFPGSASVVCLGVVIAACASGQLAEMGDGDGGGADAGMVVADTGISAIDVGVTVDAGMTLEAGTTALDAGVTAVDADMDAVDAGPEADPPETASPETPEASAPEAGRDAGAQGQCIPTTCAQQGYECGQAADGCAGVLQCGTCVSPQFCGGGGYGKCGGMTPPLEDGSIICIPATCASMGDDCGLAADGCGGVVSCGTCAATSLCGGGGPNRCGGDSGVGQDGG